MVENIDDLIVIDVLPLSLGVETADGNFSVIIPKNTALPTKRTQKYTTDSIGDNSITVKVYQGERLIANKNKLIGKFIFDRVSLTNSPVIEITFKVDVNSIISICIKDKESLYEKNIFIKQEEKLSLENIQEIINSAENNIEKDLNEYKRKELIYIIQNKTEKILDTIKYNNLINEENKKNMIIELLDNLDNIEKFTNQKLLQLRDSLNDNYIKNDIKLDNLIDDNYYNIEETIIEEKKKLLEEKINYILNKSSLTNYQLDFIQESYELLKITNIKLIELENKLTQFDNMFDIVDYYDEFTQLCFFLKEQLINNQLEIKDCEKKTLKKYILKKIDLIKNKNKDKIDWKLELNNLNIFCDKIYNKK